MPADDRYDEARVERLLRGAVDTPTPAGWSAVRARFAARAQCDGLVDVAYEDHDTPLGRMRVGATGVGIVRIVLPAEDVEEALHGVARRVSARILRGSTPTIALARRELDEYFGGRRRAFDVPLDWTLTRAFRRKVLEATVLIPYGETASYREMAAAAGSANAMRAAGSALATNPLPILVPCHRVLRSGGALGQYGGGVAAKAALLSLEQGT